MNRDSLIQKIINDNLCLGCGQCENICGDEFVKMELSSDGFFYPNVKKIDKEKEQIISRICPGVNIINDLPIIEEQAIWGTIKKLYSGYSVDENVRFKGSSGGAVSAIAIYMLENKLVDAVLQVGGDSEDYERNTLKISTSRDDVIKCASSRYAPALIFNEFFNILNRNDHKYCFIGKPCDISALKNFLNEYPQFKSRFKLTVSIMCAGMSSLNGTKEIIEEFNAKKPVKNLTYRGNGWPGFFSFTDANSDEYKKTYNESWGKTLNRHLNFRCKICPDGIGLQADIAVGDAWETKDGYPDFSEKDGHSLIIARTDTGLKLINDAFTDGYIKINELEEEKLALMQPYQFARRTRTGARVLAFNIVKGRNAVNFKNLKLFYNMRYVSKWILLKEFMGTFKRLLKS